jgi:drug/metabolite transporter (DMT)-like permease
MPSTILFIIASLIWGSTFWAITLQLGHVPPAVSVVYRFSLAALILFAFCKVRGDRLTLPWPLQRYLMLQGLASFCISYVCTYSAEQYLVSALVAILFALMVIWSPLGEHLMYQTPLGWRIWAAASMAIGGVLLLFSPALSGDWKNTPHFALGLGLAFVATLASTCGNLLVQKIRQHSSNVPLTMAWAMAWGAIWVTLWVLVTGQRWVWPDQPRYWFSLLYLAIFGTIIAFGCYFVLIHRVGARVGAYISVVTPVISVLLSIKLEHYQPGALEWLGMVLCLAGVAWAIMDNNAPPAPPAPPVNLSQHPEPS